MIQFHSLPVWKLWGLGPKTSLYGPIPRLAFSIFLWFVVGLKTGISELLRYFAAYAGLHAALERGPLDLTEKTVLQGGGTPWNTHTASSVEVAVPGQKCCIFLSKSEQCWFRAVLWNLAGVCKELSISIVTLMGFVILLFVLEKWCGMQGQS